MLPPIVTLDMYDGNFPDYLNAIYQIFKTDFIDTKPTFEGTRLGLKSYPLVDGKPYTFYHFTHEGDVESNRLPSLKRMERIPFPRPMIDNSGHEYLRVWRNTRNNKKRILIYHAVESYLVVLEDRGNFILPWTAYMVEYPNRQRKLIAEYEAYKSQNRPV